MVRVPPRTGAASLTSSVVAVTRWPEPSGLGPGATVDPRRMAANATLRAGFRGNVRFLVPVHWVHPLRHHGSADTRLTGSLETLQPRSHPVRPILCSLYLVIVLQVNERRSSSRKSATCSPGFWGRGRRRPAWASTARQATLWSHRGEARAQRRRYHRASAQSNGQSWCLATTDDEEVPRWLHPKMGRSSTTWCR
jgi:hypothetical protein